MSWLSTLLIFTLVLFCCWWLGLLGYLFYAILFGLWEWFVRPPFLLRILSFFLSIISLLSCTVLCVKLWNFSVGSLVNMMKLLAVRMECTFFLIFLWIYNHYNFAFVRLCNNCILCSQLLTQFFHHVHLSFFLIHYFGLLSWWSALTCLLP